MKKLIVVGDSFFSSFAHLTRLLRLFELCKQISSIQIETHLFAYEGEVIGAQMAHLISNAIGNGTIDKVVKIEPLENEGFYDLNKAKTFVHYTRANRHILQNELEQKAAYIAKISSITDQVMVIHSPGYFGAWYVPPLVPQKVRNVFVIDTVFHPESTITFGTTWDIDSWKGRIQTIFLSLIFYNPFIRVVNKIRAELNLPLRSSRYAMYENHPVIDPNTPAYMQLKKPIGQHWQIGPLLSSTKVSEEKLQELIDFKGSSPLVYLTLGGSAKNERFIGFIGEIVQTLLQATRRNIKFLITTGLTVSTEDVSQRLAENGAHCLVHNYYDANVATSIADVAVGVMGHGHILCAAKNRCPVVVCPVNADQVTHANLVKKLKLGESPMPVSFFEMFASETLIKKVLANAQLFADTTFSVLQKRDRYQNSRLVEELHHYDSDFQRNALHQLIDQLTTS